MVIEIQNLSKRYQLGTVSAGSISLDLNRLWARMRGKEDPAKKITSENVLAKTTKSKYVWALKNVSLQVDSGERLGIIGKNGSGKSTLLKIISRITSPTEGVVKIKGKVGSLLEIGTGFDDELTGKENIFLYGSILGMEKSEIIRNFEKIIDFSGCDRYINTPLKRYSSGMKVRLSFSVAAFLNADILILDEVFAVGDQRFKNKAMIKIKELATQHNRTILFVSHDLDAVRNNTNKCIVLDKGQIISQGNSSNVIDEYLMSTDTYHNNSTKTNNPGELSN